MARRGSGFSSLLLILGIVLAALFVYNRLVGPGLKPTPWNTRPEPHRHARRSPYGEREPWPESRGHEYREPEAGACGEFGTTCASQYFRAWVQPGEGSCRTTIRRGYPVPDPRC